MFSIKCVRMTMAYFYITYRMNRFSVLPNRKLHFKFKLARRPLHFLFRKNLLPQIIIYHLGNNSLTKSQDHTSVVPKLGGARKKYENVPNLNSVLLKFSIKSTPGKAVRIYLD